MLDMDLRLALLTFSVLPVMVVITVLLRRASRAAYRKVRAAVSWVNSVLAENVNGVRVVQAFSRQKQNYEHFRDYVNRYHLERAVANGPDLSRSSAPAWTCSGRLPPAWWSGWAGRRPGRKTITAGVLVAFILYIDRFFEPIRDSEPPLRCAPVHDDRLGTHHGAAGYTGRGPGCAETPGNCRSLRGEVISSMSRSITRMTRPSS